MNLITIVIMAVYIAVLALLGYIGYNKTKNADDYYLGGRKIHPVVMALSYGASFISSSAIVGFGGQAAVHGMSLLWLTFFNIFFGIFIAFVFFGKRTRAIGKNLQAHTFPEFLGKRYNSKFIQKFAGAIIFIFMPVYAAAVVTSAAKFMETGLKMDYNLALFVFTSIVAAYVFFGGMKSVMHAEAFQGIIMISGMVILLVAVYVKLGGIVEAHQSLTDLFSKPEVMEQTAKLQETGFQGWTKMPVFLSQNWWVVVSSILMGVGIGVLAQPQLVVRFMTVKSDRELNRAVPIGALFILLLPGVAYLTGSLSNVLFFRQSGKTALAAASNQIDSIIPMFLKENMPSWFISLFLVMLLSAAMSTISSQFIAIGTAVGKDIINVDHKNPKKALFVTRIGTLVAIIITVLLSFILPKVWEGSIAISTGLFFGICCASFLPMYFSALYFKNMKKTAAISGMIAGFSSSMLWMMFVHTKESKVLKVCSLIFGKDSLAQDSILQFVDPIIISLSISIIVTALVQLFSKQRLSDKHIEKCFEGIK